ncbi:unnamed protein product, partial [Allacma fusca]
KTNNKPDEKPLSKSKRTPQTKPTNQGFSIKRIIAQAQARKARQQTEKLPLEDVATKDAAVQKATDVAKYEPQSPVLDINVNPTEQLPED